MRTFRLVLEYPNGERVWLNVAQIVKMVKSPEGQFSLHMINGEVYNIDGRTARAVENHMEED